MIGRAVSSIAVVVVYTATAVAGTGPAGPSAPVVVARPPAKPVLPPAAAALGCGDARTLCVAPPPDKPAGGLLDGVVCPGETAPGDLRAGDILRVYVIDGGSHRPCTGAQGRHAYSVTVVMSGKRRPVPVPSEVAGPNLLWHGAAEVDDVQTFTVRVTRRADDAGPDNAVTSSFSLDVGARAARRDALPAVLPHDAPAAGDLDIYLQARPVIVTGSPDPRALEAGFELGVTNQLFVGLSERVMFNSQAVGHPDGVADALVSIGVRTRPTPDLRGRLTLSGSLPTGADALGPHDRTVAARLAVAHRAQWAPRETWTWWRAGVEIDRRSNEETALSGVGVGVRLNEDDVFEATLCVDASVAQHYAATGDELATAAGASVHLALGRWGYVFAGGHYNHSDDSLWSATFGLETRISLRAWHRSQRNMK